MPKRPTKQAAKAKPTRKTKKNPLYTSTPKNFRIGQDVLPAGRDVGRYVKWPRYIRLQRQKKILMQRLKVPPSIHQFTNTFDKNQATDLFKLLAKYKPETKKEKAERLKNMAIAKAAGKAEAGKPRPVVKFGLGHVTELIENKKAKMVAIACDVDPIELVLCLPALCRKMDIPYCIVKNKGRLGAVVGQKTATCVCLVSVDKEDQAALTRISDTCRSNFNDSESALKTWGGGIMGLRTQAKLAKREAALAAERAKKAAVML